MTEKQKLAKAFGITLYALRKQKKLTAKQLSERVEVVPSFICALEKGKKQPSLQMVLKLAEALDVHPSELVNSTAARLTDE